MKLYCKNCNEQLSVGDLTEVKLNKVDFTAEEALLPEGTFIRADKLEFEFGVEIEFLIEEDGIRVKDHPETRRLYGCCGPSDFSQYNQVCPNCNQEIGIVSGDCWVPHFIAVSGANTKTIVKEE